MKKYFQLICLGFVSLIIGGGLRLMYTLPVDTKPYVEKKYVGWNGVLQAWICSDWEPGGSFVRWLNRCAVEFEKNYEGVHLEFTPISTEPLNALADSSIRKPDLLFFSPGTLTNSELLMPLKSCDSIRKDLHDYGNGFALPIALGGYIWAYNTSLCEGPPASIDEITTLVLPTAKGYSTALLGLLSDIFGRDASQPALPNSGIDLGLPVSAVQKILFSDTALDLFINGELPYIPISSKDLKRLAGLRDNGKGPAWQLCASGSIICTDQLLMGSIPTQHDENERARLSEEFLLFLLNDESQSELADIGAHSVTGETIHSGFSFYAELDALLNSRSLWLPSCFSEYSSENSEAIVRRFLNKDFTAKEALNMLKFEGM